MSKCHHPNCNNDIFSHNYCRIHQWRRKDEKYLAQKEFKKNKTTIPKESKKRKEEAKTYKQVKDELRTEMVANGTYNCFFCGLPMGNHFEFHHLQGREGNYYIDPKYLVPAHSECHVYKYHRYTVQQLLQESWYQAFLQRLKAIDPKLYNQEKNKQFKANLFDDEN